MTLVAPSTSPASSYLRRSIRGLHSAINFSWNPGHARACPDPRPVRPAGQRCSACLMNRGVRLLRDSTVPKGLETHAHIPANEKRSYVDLCRIMSYVSDLSPVYYAIRCFLKSIKLSLYFLKCTLLLTHTHTHARTHAHTRTSHTHVCMLTHAHILTYPR